MEEIFLILKPSILFLLLTSNVLAISVLVTKNSIGFEQKINTSELRLMNIPVLKKACIPVKLKDIQNNEYISTHYINSGSILCQKDLRLYKKESVIFNFGSLEIETKGKIIYENDEFIRIKKEDGEIEKFYKDGRLQ